MGRRCNACRLPPTERAEILDARLRGASWQELGMEFDVPWQSLKRHFRVCAGRLTIRQHSSGEQITASLAVTYFDDAMRPLARAMQRAEERGDDDALIAAANALTDAATRQAQLHIRLARMLP